MAIMTCPKCGGGGEIVKYEQPGFTTAGGTMPQTCSSCGGTGYVTDDTYTISEKDVKYNYWPTPIIPRDPQRIEYILAELRDLWKQFPDWRLGQLLINAIPELENSPFYLEDTVVLERLRKFSEKASS